MLLEDQAKALRETAVSLGFEFREATPDCPKILKAIAARPIDATKFFREALQRFMPLLDPHSSYFPPEGYRQFQEEQRNRHEGFGIAFHLRARDYYFPLQELRIEEVFQEVLQTTVDFGDRVVRINGDPIVGKNLTDWSQAFYEADELEIEIDRKGRWRLRPLSYTLPPAFIRRISARHGDYRYVKIRNFHPELTRFVRDHFDELEDREGLILDLRGNPGGSVDEALDLCAWLSSVPIHVETRGEEQSESVRRRYQLDQTYERRAQGRFQGVPFALLADARSASASELLAASLRPTRAVLIGRRTFGKGIGQHTITLSEKNGLGGAMMITMFRYWVGDGFSPQAIGVAPEIEVLDTSLESRIARLRREQRPVVYEEMDLGDRVVPRVTKDEPAASLGNVQMKWACQKDSFDCELEIAMTSLYELRQQGYFE